MIETINKKVACDGVWHPVGAPANAMVIEVVYGLLAMQFAYSSTLEGCPEFGHTLNPKESKGFLAGTQVWFRGSSGEEATLAITGEVSDE